VEGGTQTRRLCAHINIHTHSHGAVPPKGADTHGVRDKGTHICGRPGTPPCPAHPPLPALGPEQGLLRARLPPDSFPRMFPYLACQVSGERASEMQQEPLGGRKLELAVPCLALPANSLTEKLFAARAGWPGEPPATSPSVPSPRRRPRPSGGLGCSAAAQCPAA
jgi:hypothetical protein